MKSCNLDFPKLQGLNWKIVPNILFIKINELKMHHIDI